MIAIGDLYALEPAVIDISLCQGLTESTGHDHDFSDSPFQVVPIKINGPVHAVIAMEGLLAFKHPDSMPVIIQVVIHVDPGAQPQPVIRELDPLPFRIDGMMVGRIIVINPKFPINLESFDRSTAGSGVSRTARS